MYVGMYVYVYIVPPTRPSGLYGQFMPTSILLQLPRASIHLETHETTSECMCMHVYIHICMYKSLCEMIIIIIWYPDTYKMIRIEVKVAPHTINKRKKKKEIKVYEDNNFANYANIVNCLLNIIQVGASTNCRI